MSDLSKISPLAKGYARVTFSNEIWDIPLANLDKILAEYKSVKVLARTQNEWLNHINTLIRSPWKFRIFITADDIEFLEQCGISWGEGADTAAQMREKGTVIMMGIPAEEGA